MTRTPGKHALLFIFITVLIDVTGLGIIIPVIPQLIMELTGEGIARAAVFGGALMFLYSLVQFFAAPFVGSLSDRFGRRPVLLFSLLGFGIDYGLMGLAPSLAHVLVTRAATHAPWWQTRLGPWPAAWSAFPPKVYATTDRNRRPPSDYAPSK